MRLQQAKSTGHKYVKYCVVGGSGALIQLGLIYLFTEWIGLFYLASAVVAILFVSVWNFTWNLKWTFTDSKEVSWIANLFQNYLYRLRR